MGDTGQMLRCRESDVSSKCKDLIREQTDACIVGTPAKSPIASSTRPVTPSL